MKKVHMVITSNFDLFSSFKNGVDSVWREHDKENADSRCEELNKKYQNHHYHYEDGPFRVETFHLKQDK